MGRARQAGLWPDQPVAGAPNQIQFNNEVLEDDTPMVASRGSSITQPEIDSAMGRVLRLLIQQPFIHHELRKNALAGAENDTR